MRRKCPVRRDDPAKWMYWAPRALLALSVVATELLTGLPGRTVALSGSVNYFGQMGFQSLSVAQALVADTYQISLGQHEAMKPLGPLRVMTVSNISGRMLDVQVSLAGISGLAVQITKTPLLPGEFADVMVQGIPQAPGEISGDLQLSALSGYLTLDVPVSGQIQIPPPSPGKPPIMLAGEQASEADLGLGCEEATIPEDAVADDAIIDDAIVDDAIVDDAEPDADQPLPCEPESPSSAEPGVADPGAADPGATEPDGNSPPQDDPILEDETTPDLSGDEVIPELPGDEATNSENDSANVPDTEATIPPTETDITSEASGPPDLDAGEPPASDPAVGPAVDAEEPPASDPAAVPAPDSEPVPSPELTAVPASTTEALA